MSGLCGVFATRIKGRALTRPRDLPYGERGLEFFWHKRRWWCGEPACPRKSFTESLPQIPTEARITERLRAAAGRRVRDAGSTVIQTARDLRLSWSTVMAAFTMQAREVTGAPLPEVKVLGIDETRRGRTKWEQDAETGKWQLVRDHPPTASCSPMPPARAWTCSTTSRATSPNWNATPTTARPKLGVHRKGATLALPPGHPDLPDALRPFGQPVFVPGTMGTASYVMTGSIGNRAFGSCCHGAGRVWSRHRAHREMSARQLRRKLVDAGVAVRPASWRSVIEEAPEAYKDVDAVVRASEHNDLGRLVARLVPLGVLKG
ncbi:RtcB family protein [Streptomyces mirabilis]|uniref:RtcB family protein n=1 Tax=Streptomyces mirabilis TaxID=68239 RepID=UPI00369D5C1D